MFSFKTLIYRSLLHFFVIMSLYSASRVLFILIDRDNFILDSIFSVQFINLLLGGMRFDSVIFAISNGILIILSFFPLHYLTNKIYQKTIGCFFVILNSLFLLLNFVDIAYYPYVQKRMQKDVLQFLDGKHGNEFYSLLPGFIIQFWYLILIFTLFVFVLIRVNSMIQNIDKKVNISIKQYFIHIIFYIAILGFLVIGFRGGTQYRPIDVITASEMAAPANVNIVLNTPFTIAKSLANNKIDLKFLNAGEIPDMNKFIVKNNGKKSEFKKKNIVVLIVESLSRKYVGYYNGKPVTPFLDSLMGHSIVFDNAFANAKTSMEGIPSILASIPAWMDDPFIYSYYSSNQVTSFASLLRPFGYETAFFHGGRNGSMGFNDFCKLAEIQHYFGKDQYPDQKDFDGKWGIWDEPFLQFTCNKLSKFHQPFFASIFTLNTHHPFTIPEKYNSIFHQSGHPLYTCLRYADHSIEKFFETAKKQSWYSNTIFVITADHTAIDIVGEKPIALEEYRIPIIFFDPEKHYKIKESEIISQIDILPTVMEMIDYPYDYFSLGKPYFESNNISSINYKSDIYQVVTKNYLYQFNGKRCLGLYDWQNDPQLKRNIKFQNNDYVLNSLHNILTDNLLMFKYGMESNKLKLTLKNPK